MENICKNCINCIGGNHQTNATTESFKIKDSSGYESSWFPTSGSKCKITDCWIMDVQECERFEEKQKEDKNAIT